MSAASLGSLRYLFGMPKFPFFRIKAMSAWMVLTVIGGGPVEPQFLKTTNDCLGCSCRTWLLPKVPWQVFKNDGD
jgi:hypothetical protein